MANVALLLLGYHDDLDTNQHDPRTDIVVEASYILPVLWCSVFTIDDIRQYPVESDQGEQTVCPMLITPSDEARRRALERRARFADVFPATLQGMYQEWLALLNDIEAPYLMLSMVEIWGMDDDHASFDAFLAASLRAFETNAADDWGELLGQFPSMSYDAHSNRVSVVEGYEDYPRHDLYGYRCMRPVPWTE